MWSFENVLLTIPWTEKGLSASVSSWLEFNLTNTVSLVSPLFFIAPIPPTIEPMPTVVNNPALAETNPAAPTDCRNANVLPAPTFPIVAWHAAA